MSELLPCPLCGDSKGYTLRERSTHRWWVVECAACGRPVDEARAMYPRETTPRTDAADIVWNEAAKHADALRHELDDMRRQYEIASGAAQMHMISARELAAKNAELLRWKSTHAPRITALEGLWRDAQSRLSRADEAIASLASERAANALLTDEAEKLRSAVHEADNLMGHDDAFTEWRERWAHLWPTPQPAAHPSNPPTAASDPAAAP